MIVVGISEIAMRAGVQKPAVQNWRTRYPEFPKPLAELVVGPVWLWEDVEVWLKATRRRTNAGWTREQVSRDRWDRVTEKAS